MIFLDRRRFLTGLGLGAGAFLLNPLLRSWIREAEGQVPAAKRLVLFTQGNGVRSEHLHLDAPNQTDFELSGSIYEPLVPFRDKLLVVNKFYNPHDRALHGNQWATLSVMPSPNQEGEKRGPPGGITIDRVIANAIGGQDAFKQVLLALKEGSKSLCVSADGLERPVPAINNPLEAFETVFGGGVQGQDPQIDLAAQFAQDKGLLDFIREDIGRTHRRLAGPERLKLDQYVASLEQLEVQLKSASTALANCQDIPGPDVSSEDLIEKYESARLHRENVEAHVDLAANALKCGLTHVTHNSIMGMEGPHDAYYWLGDDMSHHGSHHDGRIENLRQIDTFTMSALARMANHLDAVPEGDGTMLDNSLILYINTCGGKHHGGHDQHFAIMLGSAGGAFRTGRFLTTLDGKNYAYNDEKRCISDFYVNVANAFGVDIDTFGDPEHCLGPIDGLT